MYKRLDKKKENKSRSIVQKEGGGKQSFGFVDNRREINVKRVFDTGLSDRIKPLNISEGVVSNSSGLVPLVSMQTGGTIQLMKVTMPDNSVVDTDYMDNNTLEEAMNKYREIIRNTHFANPQLKFYEVNYNRLSQALLQRTYGQHLLIGEGDFGYSHSLSKMEHTSYNHNPPLLATEFRQQGQLEVDYPDTFHKNVEHVVNAGGDVRFGVDAMKMTDSFHQGSHFPVVTSMFPNTGSRNRQTQGPLTHDVVGGLFSGSSKFQESGDQLVLTVPQKYDSSIRHRTYGMQKHAPGNGYALMNKFQFDPVKHPPYEHRMTKENKSAKSMDAGDKGVSYVFLKAPKGTVPVYDSDFETDEEPENIYDARGMRKK